MEVHIWSIGIVSMSGSPYLYGTARGKKTLVLVAVDGRVCVEYRVWFHGRCTGDPWAAKLALKLG